MSRTLTRGEVREIDRLAIEEYGLPGILLMENAGANAARLLEALHISGPVALACGPGNNGGDGLVIARHLDAAGHAVRLLLACTADRYHGDAALNLRVAERAGLSIDVLAEADRAAWDRALGGAAWIVDALLGTGATGPPRGSVATAIAAIDAARGAGARVLAVDLPSGLDCDTGAAAGVCVRADATATFVAAKAGFDRPGAAAFTGTVHVLGIGVPRALLARFGLTPTRGPGTSSPGHP